MAAGDDESTGSTIAGIDASEMALGQDIETQNGVNYELADHMGDGDLKASLLEAEEEVIEDGGDEFHGGGSHDTSVPRTFINFLKSYIGSGILGLPAAFLNGGVLLSIIGVLVVAVITHYCIRLLLECSIVVHKEGRASYQQVGRKAFGKYGKLLVDFALILTQVGMCCAYVIYITTTFNSVYEGIPVWAYAALVCPFLVLVCWVRDFKLLAYVSLFGQVAIAIGLLACLAYSFEALIQNQPTIVGFNWKGFPVFFGMVVYTFEGIGLVLPMRKSMANPQFYPIVMDMGYLVVTLSYLVFGTVGYLGFGMNTAGEITDNLPPGPVSQIIRLLLIFAIFCTYPVQLYPIFGMSEFALLKNTTKSGWTLEWIRNGIRTSIVVFTVVVAVSIPYFSLFIGLIGAVGCSLMSFILPCIFHIKMFPEASVARKGTNWSFLIFGVIASIISAGVTTIQLIQAIFG